MNVPLLVVAVVLQVGLTIGALACLVLVLVQLFRRGQVALGLLAILFWPLAFVLGWVRAAEWNFKRVMWVWTGCILGTTIPLTLFTVAAASHSLARFDEQRTRVELEDLAAALDAYREQKLTYPPSDVDRAMGHMQRAFPRSTERPDAFTDGSQSLVFWLSRTSRNPRLPFSDGDKVVYFEFDPARLDTQSLTYRPPGDGLKTRYRYTSDGVSFKLEAAGPDDKFDTPDDLAVTRSRPG